MTAKTVLKDYEPSKIDLMQNTQMRQRAAVHRRSTVSKNLIPPFIFDQLAQQNSQGSFMATTLFADISGFTALTESLMRHGTEGAEVLSKILDDIFAPMVALVYAHEGLIPHFAGDAFTAIFPTISPENVLDIAADFQKMFADNAVRRTKFGDFKVSLRVGLSQGSVDWGIVGGVNKTFYFRGAAIDQAAAAEHEAQPSEIVIDNHFYEHIKSQNIDFQLVKENFYKFTPLSKKQVTGDRGQATGDSQQATAKKHSTAQPSSHPTIQPFNHSALQQFLPQSVIEFNEKGEFRDVASIFISFEGVQNHADLAAYTDLVLTQLYAFGGYFKELDFGDKGGLMVGFFGAPTAFENNLSRALECLLAIKDELSHLQTQRPFRFRAGMTSGVAYTGIVGGVERCQYAVVGTRVNLAARLALAADWGEILVDKHVLHAKSFDFSDKGDIVYKGFAEPQPTFRLVKKRAEEKPIFAGDMVGRDAELEVVVSAATEALGASMGSVVQIWGEAGVGKSRLTYELRRQLERFLIHNWAMCQSDQILRKPFNPFIYFLKNYFLQNVENTAAQNLKNFEVAFQKLVRSLPEAAFTEGGELIRTQSVLAALVGLSMPNSLWEQLDARGRYDNTMAALDSFFLALARVRPTVLELEDAHWLDEDSAAFLRNFVKKIADAPLLIVATSRYDDEQNKQSVFEEAILRGAKIRQREVDLNMLSMDGLRQLAEAKLRGQVHPDLVEMLWRATNGNPFYTEQIVAYFIENNLLQLIDNQWTTKDKTIKISNSIQAILTARIDRLSSILKETVKAAAVIGREFELPVLSEVILQHDEYLRRNGNGQLVLREQVQNAEKGQIWRAMNELRYIFRHTLLREAVYDMQLKTRLRELHFMIAKAIEKVYADNIEQRFVDLAFHYEQSEVASKTIEYLRKAAEYARRNYQNAQALEFYDRLMKHGEDEVLVVKTLVKKGEVLQLIGRWSESEICFHQALFKAASTGDMGLKGKTHNAIGTLMMLKGSYSEARTYLEKAAAYSEQIVDYQGIVKAYGNLGNLYFRQGDYDSAKNYLLRCIQIARENELRSAPAIVSNLALTYMNQGDYTEGVKLQREELNEAEKATDKTSAATLWVNLGIVYAEKGDDNAALNCFEKGLELCQVLGNKQLISIALGCLGNIWRLKGNFEKATDYLEQDLKICLELGDLQGIAIAYELRGRLLVTKGDLTDAQRDFGESLRLCRQLNYQKGIAKSLQGLGDAASFKNDFLKALTHYDEAAEIARKINNQLILGQCLVEKGNVLLRVGDFAGARALQTQAYEVSENLGNEKLTAQVVAFLKKLAVA
jgi:predicted ATPase/class 3 adenylate cyclase